MRISIILMLFLCVFVNSYLYADEEDTDKMFMEAGGKISTISVDGKRIKYYSYDKNGKSTFENNLAKRNFTVSISNINGREKLLKKLLENFQDFVYLKHVQAISINIEESKLPQILRKIMTQFSVRDIVKTPYKNVFSKKLIFDKAIHSSEVSTYSPNDPLFKSQWYLYNENNPNVDIGFLSYRKFIAETNYKPQFANPPVVAVLDVGIFYDSNELRDRIYINTNEIPNNGIDEDDNGYADDYMGVDVGHPECTLLACIDNYNEHHGTAMASIMGAKTDNNYYMSGILPDEVKIMPVSASYDYTQVDRYNEGYEYLLEMKERGVNIISVNVSAGGPFDPTEYRLLKEFYDAGILVVAAAGNEDINIDIDRGIGSEDFTRAYPAKYDLNNVIAVSAYDENGQVASFANYGDTVDIYMPGVNIISLAYPERPGYVAIGSGTSQAAAIASGLVGVAAYLYPDCNPIELRSLILESAVEPIGQFVVRSRSLLSFLTSQTFTMEGAKISSVDGVGLITDGKLQNYYCGTYGIGW